VRKIKRQTEKIQTETDSKDKHEHRYTHVCTCVRKKNEYACVRMRDRKKEGDRESM
jgi:hypothetical protein